MATRLISGLQLAHALEQRFPGAVADANPEWVEVRPEHLLDACLFLRDDPELDFKFLSCLTAVDRLDHFEVVYHLQSLRLNQMGVLKVRLWDRENPVVHSVTPVWLGAGLQEREAYDLMGIRFQGHPDLRRLFLWEGFPGHPLRKDWLAMPGQRMPGLQRFPGEPGEPDTGRG
ncbi:NADH-quinone oxidoreductase chain 5 [bacterium HR25]|jgi:NADH-quinone oxidoreductase subunit C|nr:NADH-quinone oxidoreductase chain 5 [bacterium HR25]